jgi:hypothetical protein
MRPKSLVSFLICCLGLILSGVLLLARVTGIIPANWLTVALALSISAISLFYLIKEFLRKPFIKEYHHKDWIVEDAYDRKGVYIKIPRSIHGAGNKPSYSFVNKGSPYWVDFEVKDEEGNLTIYHQGYFMLNDYKPFVIRIT